MDIFVNKLNNLANLEATFNVESDSSQVDKLKKLAKDIESKKITITSSMLADGDYYIFPSTNRRGEIVHSYLKQQQVRILDMDGDEIREAYGIIDWVVDKSSRVFFLLRHHLLEDNGTLSISYLSINENNKPTYVDEWKNISGKTYVFQNANHIGFGRYKSPKNSRGLSPIYGVPLNFGCSEIEKIIFEDLELIYYEFKNGKSKIFADPTILRKKGNQEEYNIPENVFPVQARAGQSGSLIDIFNPSIRSSEHYEKLMADLALYEKQVGTSRGILTDPEPTSNATATEIKRANADTISLLDNIHTAIQNGNEMTLKADSVFLNISDDLWSVSADWYDPFEDPDSQWKRLTEAKDAGAVETVDLVKWLYPTLTEKELQEKIARINAERTVNTNTILDSFVGGA